MTELQKWLLNVSVGLLVVSGTAFAIMKYLLVSSDPYSAVGHPLEPWALALHVLTGPLVIFAIGWIFREHIAGRRRGRNGRPSIGSGLVAAALLLPMVASGYLLQAVTGETLKQALVVVHLVSGGLFAVCYAVHLIRARAARAALILLVLLAIGATLASGATVANPCDGVERARQVMGSLARVVVCDPEDPAKAASDASAALDVFDRVDRLMSLYKPESDLSRLNREGYPGPVALDAELIEVLDRAHKLSRETDGKFDVTIKPLMDHYGFYGDLGFAPPAGGLAGALALVGEGGLVIDRAGGAARFARSGMGVDLGGIAKGYALDVAAQALRERGVRRAFLDLGRELMFLGPGPFPGARWRAAIADPEKPGAIAACVEVEEGALSTSSTSGRTVAGVGHILDPVRGYVPGRAAQATVWSASATRADAISTAILLLDPKAVKRMLAHHDDAAVVYGPSRRVTGPIRIARCG